VVGVNAFLIVNHLAQFVKPSCRNAKLVPTMKPRVIASSNLWKALTSVAIDAVFPPRCAGEQRGCEIWSHALFCEPCRATLKKVSEPLCGCCGTSFDPLAKAANVCARCRDNRYHAAPPFEALRSVYVFEGAIRHAVHRFKYKGKTALAPQLAVLLLDFLQSSTHFPSPDAFSIVVPVPLHPWRKWRRGYNQSELLAKEVAHGLQIPTFDALSRVRHTGPQIELTRSQRQQNVRDAFALKPSAQVQNSVVLLVDDVHTTGATLSECARILKEGGATEVYGLTLARQL
jgi:ComF family protein